jgi:nucleoside-diphosphate-sugar epimerase
MTAPGFTVLGASGFLGSALVSHLQKLGRQVRAVRREDGLALCQPLGHVIYAIGVTADFRVRPFDTMDAHVTQVTRLLREGDFSSLTYLSSTRVYEGNEETSEDAAISVMPTSPSALYNISKIAGESICLNSGRANVRVARLSNVVGVGLGQDSFLDQLLREGLAHGALTLRSHPASAKDYIALDDALGLLVAVTERGKAAIYNIASGEQTSHREVLDVITAETGWSVAVDETAARTDFPPINIGRIREEFGFVPVPFRAYFADHIRHAIEFAKDNK